MYESLRTLTIPRLRIVDSIEWPPINSRMTRLLGNMFKVRYKEMTEDKR